MTQNDENMFYEIGMRDMLAQLFMEIRLDDVDTTLKKYAELLKDNPHAQDYLQKLK